MNKLKNGFKKVFSNKKVMSVLKLIMFILIALVVGYFIFTGKQV